MPVSEDDRRALMDSYIRQTDSLLLAPSDFVSFVEAQCAKERLKETPDLTTFLNFETHQALESTGWKWEKGRFHDGQVDLNAETYRAYRLALIEKFVKRAIYFSRGVCSGTLRKNLGLTEADKMKMAGVYLGYSQTD